MLSEFELIGRYFTHPVHHSVLGVGDDAALIKMRRGHELAISADMLVAGRHFFHDTDPYLLGHKALAVNLSDLAAMGAKARWVTLALALPRADESWLKAFARGFMALARQHDVDLIGGDTTRGPLNICVQIMGEVPAGKALRRDAAQIGDDIWVSGSLGDAALAVAAHKHRIQLSVADLRYCERRLNQPQPRTQLGIGLRGVARSAIDVSDGLLGDLGHILERSRLAADIEWECLPTSKALRLHLESAVARKSLLAGGDDYELCFTAPPRARQRIAAIGKRLRVAVTRIGHIRASIPGKKRLVVRTADGSALRTTPGGYDHFG